MMPVLATATVVISVMGLAYVTAVAVQMTKFLLNHIVPPGSPDRDSVVRLYVFLVAGVVVFLVDWLNYDLTSRAAYLSAIANAINVGGIAIAQYHVLTPTAFPSFRAMASEAPPRPPEA